MGVLAAGSGVVEQGAMSGGARHGPRPDSTMPFRSRGKCTKAGGSRSGRSSRSPLPGASAEKMRQAAQVASGAELLGGRSSASSLQCPTAVVQIDSDADVAIAEISDCDEPPPKAHCLPSKEDWLSGATSGRRDLLAGRDENNPPISCPPCPNGPYL